MVCHSGIKSSHLLNKTDLVMTGHFHSRDEREYNKGKIVYMGNPFQMDFGDSGLRKGYYTLDLSTKEHNFTQNTISPTHEKITLSGLVEHGDVDAHIKNKIKNNIVRFIVDRNIAPDEIEQLLRLLSSFKPLTLKILS